MVSALFSHSRIYIVLFTRVCRHAQNEQRRERTLCSNLLCRLLACCFGALALLQPASLIWKKNCVSVTHSHISKRKMLVSVLHLHICVHRVKLCGTYCCCWVVDTTSRSTATTEGVNVTTSEGHIPLVVLPLKRYTALLLVGTDPKSPTAERGT